MKNLSLTWFCLGSILIVATWWLLARIIRQRYPFPIPYFMIHFIDNPFRRMIQPPHKMPGRMGITPGMHVLEIGPGSGTYTLATAKAVGAGGRIVAIDIEARVVEYLKRRIAELDVANLEVQQGDAQKLEFETASFDAVYALTVYGEIPDRRKALAAFRRVLKPGGLLAISEILLDPDSQPRKRVIAECEAAGFRLVKESGNLLHYTLLFDSPMS